LTSTLICSTHGQNVPAGARHKIGIGLPVWLNATAEFKAHRATNPGAAPATPAVAADGRVDRFYDNGFNRVNSAGNPILIPGQEPLTSFFGYHRDAQVMNAPGAGTLSLHSVELNGGDYTSSQKNQPRPGVEGFYRHHWKQREKWSVYLDLAAGYQFFNWRVEGVTDADANLLTDTFNLGGVTLAPGAAPYEGPFTTVPGAPLIGSNPTRAIADVPATVSGYRQIDFHAIRLRLAPSLMWQPNDRWALGLQSGLSLGFGYSKLEYSEDIAVAGQATGQNDGSSDEHFWLGLCNSIQVSRRIGERWRVFGEARHLLTSKLEHTGRTRSAETNLSDGIGMAAGLIYSFP
tara:strand:+ start:2279 stop:3319 length:1041 start_codon:yes stop_codon:yes gene_type:complete